MKITKQCVHCIKDFEVDLREHKRGNGKYCSRVCLSESFRIKRTKIIINNCVCSLCKIDFYKKPSSLINSKSGLYFCSRKCKDLAQRLESGFKELLYTKGNYKTNAYRTSFLRNNDSNKCSNCGYNEHPEILQVHHIDRNRKNSNLDNLKLLCPNCHQWEHYCNKDGSYSKLK